MPRFLAEVVQGEAVCFEVIHGRSVPLHESSTTDVDAAAASSCCGGMAGRMATFSPRASSSPTVVRRFGYCSLHFWCRAGERDSGLACSTRVD